MYFDHHHRETNPKVDQLSYVAFLMANQSADCPVADSYNEII